MECPICLEPLEGTVVNLGCCKQQVHIQCYLPKCSLCRAQLPEPPKTQPEHVVVSVPVPVQVPHHKIVTFVPMLFGLSAVVTLAVLITHK